MGAKQENMSSAKMKKKRKSEVIEGDKSSQTPPKKKEKKYFSEIEFKVMIKEPTTTFTALEKFLEQSKLWTEDNKAYDIVAKFCLTTAECAEIIKLLEVRSRKAQEIALIFETLESILLRIADDLKKFHILGRHIVREILTGHRGHVYNLLAMKNKASHIKASLRLATAMVLLGEDSARDVIVQFDFQHVVVAPLLNRRDRKDPQDVRTCYLTFLMAFLFAGDVAVKQMVDNKGVLNAIFPGFLTDKLETLQTTISTLLEQIVRNPAISKTSKIGLFNEASLHHLSKLYHWQGPQAWSGEKHGSRKQGKQPEQPSHVLGDGESSPDQEAVQDLVQQLLLELCCSLKTGINFWDRTLGTAGKNQNHVLTSLLTSLPRPYTSDRQRLLVSGVLRACPDQLAWYLPSLQETLSPRASDNWATAVSYLCQETLSPRASDNWATTVSYLCQIYGDQTEVSVAVTQQITVTTQKLVAMTMNTLFPPKVVWALMTSAVKKEDLFVQYHGLKVVLVIAARVAATLRYCHDNQAMLPHGFIPAITEVIIKTLPNLETLTNCWNRCVKSSRSEDKDEKPKPSANDSLAPIEMRDHLRLLLQLLCTYQDELPTLFRDHRLDYNSLLEGVRLVQQRGEQQKQEQPGQQREEEQQTEQPKEQPTENQTPLLLYLLKLLAETDVRQFNWSKENVGGRSTLYLLLEMVSSTSQDAQTNRIVRHLVDKLFQRTGYFSDAPDEVDLWLATIATSSLPTTVVTFMEKAISRLLRLPAVYVTKVQDAIATRADTMATEAGGEEAMETGSVTTNAELIESILALDEVDLTEDNFEFTNDNMTPAEKPQPKASALFSPLVPAVLDVLDKEADNPKLSELSQFVQTVLCQIAHTREDPGPLCALISAHPGYKALPGLTASVQRWLPGATDSQPGPPPPVPSWQTLGEALRAAYDRGDDHLVSTDVRGTLEEQSRTVYASEGVPLSKQVLLYVRTALGTPDMTPKKISKLLSFYGKLLMNIVSSVAKDEDVPSKDGSAQISMLHIPEQKSEDILRDMFSVILLHPTMLDTFLNSTADRDIASRILSPVIAAVVSLVPGTMDLAGCLGPYLEKIDTLLSAGWDLSEAWKVESLVPFTSRLSTNSLCLLLEHVLDSKENIRTVVIDRLTTDDNLAKHSLPLEVFRKLCEDDSPALRASVSRVLAVAPSYSVALSRAVFCGLLTAASPAVPPALTHNVCCRRWYQDWVLEAGTLRKRRGKWAEAPRVLAYVTADRGALTDPLMSQIYKAYWPPLCDWLRGQAEDALDLEDKMAASLVTALIDKADSQALVTSLLADLFADPPTDPTVISRQLGVLRHAQPSLRPEDMVHPALGYTAALLGGLLDNKAARGGAVVTETLEVMGELCKNLPEDKSLDPTESWTRFIKLGLKHLYTSSDGRYLRVLSSVLPVLYTEDRPLPPGPSVTDIHAMVTSHSAYLRTVLQENTHPGKDALVDLLLTLVDLDPECCQTSHIAVLLGAYGATLSLTDQKILLILKKHEQAGCNLSSYKPYMWGPKSVEYHTARKNLGPSLSKAPSMDQVVDLLDKEKLLLSATAYPLLRAAQTSVQDPVTSLRSRPDLYDPCFLLPLFSHLLGPENLVNAYKFTDHGCVAFVVAGLSCHDNVLRGAAYLALARLVPHLEGATKFADRHQILYLLGLVRTSSRATNQKLPCVVSVFLAKAIQLMMKPDDHMYSLVNSFLLVKPAMDLTNVPEFYKLFNSSGFEYKTERSWMLTLLAEGLRDTADYHVFQHRFTFKLLLSFYESAISDKHTQLQVLQIVSAACQIRSVGGKLVKECGLLPWLGGAVHSGCHDTAKVAALTDVLHSLWFSALSGKTQPPGVTSGHSPEGSTSACLPVLFTSQMALLVQQLLTELTSPPPLAAFHKLTACLSSIGRHGDQTEQLIGASYSHQIMSVHLRPSHVIGALSLWAELSNDTGLLRQTQGYRDNSGAKPAAKQTSQSKEETQLDDAKVEDLKKDCLQNIIALVPLCKVRTAESDEVDKVLLMISWSLEEISQSFGSDLEKYEGLVLWILELLKTWSDLSLTLLSDQAQSQLIVRGLLALYDRAGHLQTVKQDTSLFRNLGQIFLTLTDQLWSQDLNELPVAELVKNKAYQKTGKILKALSSRKQDHDLEDILTLFILEVWQMSDKPAQFLCMAEKVLEAH